jgi:hypothetical protein
MVPFHQSLMAQSIAGLELVLNFSDALRVDRVFRIVLVISGTQNWIFLSTMLVISSTW